MFTTKQGYNILTEKNKKHSELSKSFKTKTVFRKVQL